MSAAERPLRRTENKACTDRHSRRGQKKTEGATNVAPSAGTEPSYIFKVIAAMMVETL